MFLTASRLATALLALSISLPAWAADNLIEPIGWSADEQRVAVRVYHFVDTEFDDEAVSDCKGYVDHKGAAFTGSLSFAVYEKGKQVATFPIQDSDKCTPPKTAKARLTKAKEELLKLGIDLKLKQPGTILTPKPIKDGAGVAVTLTEGPGAPYTLEAVREGTLEFTGAPSEAEGEEAAEEDDVNRERREKGELVVYVKKDGQRKKLAARKYDYTYLPAIGDMLEVSLAQVWLSPQGKTTVFLSEYVAGMMRGRTDSFEVMGGASWDGVPLVLR